MKINIGCGTSPTTGWINFDCSLSVRLSRHPIIIFSLRKFRLLDKNQLNFIKFNQDNKIHYADASRKLPLANDSVELAYSSHMLEHLDRDGAVRCLNELRRVLKVGGALRIVLPNLRLIAIDYIESHNSADQFMINSGLGFDLPKTFFHKCLFNFLGPRHHLWMYDEVTITNLLEGCGFGNITLLKPGETTIPDVGALNLSERNGSSIYIEARRI